MTIDRKVFFTLFTVISLTLIAAAPAAAKPPVLKGKDTACVVLDYNFDTVEKDFPDIELPDNAILLLKGVDGNCEPDEISVVQGGKTFSAVGSDTLYIWGVFHAVYFDIGFDKFKPYELRTECGKEPCKLSIGDEELNNIAAGSKKRGTAAYEDPVTEEVIQTADPIELAAILSHGRYAEYSELGLAYLSRGGVPLIRMKARQAYDDGDMNLAASLASLALKWSLTEEPVAVRKYAMFQDWVLCARAFWRMGYPSAAVIAFDEALKIKADKDVYEERARAEKDHFSKVNKSSDSAMTPELSEIELTYEPHGSIPIPFEERYVLVPGIKANGVFLGDHKDRYIAQCGEPSATFSDVLIYFDHLVCPDAIFISAKNRGYMIRTGHGRTVEGFTIGTSIGDITKRYGTPDRTEPILDKNGKQIGARWVYAKRKIAFVDFTGDKKVDAIDIFNYEYIK